MNENEQATRPILTPLIQGKTILLGEESQLTLSQWVTMKLMVIENRVRSSAVISQAERSLFKETRAIPPDLYIWFSPCGRGRWTSAAFRVGPVGNFLGPNKPIGDVPWSTLALGLGDLFIFAATPTAPGADIDAIMTRSMMRRLWPFVAPIWWPSPRLTASGADQVANLVRRPWGPKARS